MKWIKLLLFRSFIVWWMLPAEIQAEILAMVNYETKSEQVIRKEGIAIIEVDQNSADFGNLRMDIPLPYNLLNHHIVN